MPRKKTDKQSEELLLRVKDRFKIMYDADEDNRILALEDMKFVNIPGEQWDENMKQERGSRPCYEFNKVRVSGKRVINDMRANRPQGKIRAVEGGDVETAETNEGLVRNIWNVSDAETVTDYAAEYQVNGGMGAWRVDTEYSDDTAFNQDIVIQAIQNPFCLFVDPRAKDFLKRDADDWILTERISHAAFEEKYGDEEKSDFDGDSRFDDEDWSDEDTVRLAEYWYKVPHEKEVWMMRFPDEDQDRVVDSESDEGAAIAQSPKLMALIQRKRVIQASKIMSVIASGNKILEGPSEWAGTKFPFIMVFGEFLVIDGRHYWWGLPRFAKDAQRSYNVARTAISETIAQAPKEFFWSTPDQAEGLTSQWAEGHKKNLPFKLYNPDSKAPGPPTRVGGADVPIALIQESQIASDEIKAVTGIFDASFGASGNETSGRAIFARQQQGEIATFNFQDNMSKGIQLTYELILDLIPNIYDTERELRILGSDGAEDYVKVNQVVQDPSTGKSMRVNDLSAGKYDVTVTIGPNFSTLRQEAAETYSQLGQSFPDLMPVAGDLIFKSMDLPYADDIAERLRTLLPPQIQEIINKDQELPPEVQQAMQQVQEAMRQVQEQGQLVQEAAGELEGEKALNEKQKAEIKTEQANVKTAAAEFDKHVAETMLKIIEAKTGLVTQDADLKIKGAELKEAVVEFGQKAMSETVDVAGALSTVSKLDEILSQFMTAIDQANQVQGNINAELTAKADRKPVGGTVRHEGGKMIADVEFDDGSTRSVSGVRKDGRLQIVPNSEVDGG